MKIIISPAKKMKRYEYLSAKTVPLFMKETEKLTSILKQKSLAELKELYHASDKITKEAFDNFKSIDLYRNVSPALLSYDGIQFKYMAPNVFTEDEFDYCERHLIILSGFYGLLHPFDGVVPYRLEMNQSLSGEDFRSLYDFWKDRLYLELLKDHEEVINLCSEEYGTAIRRHLQPEDRFIEMKFYEENKGKLSEKGVYCKMARGSMTAYMAENNIEDSTQLKSFTGLGYHYEESLSSEKEFVFIRKENIEC